MSVQVNKNKQRPFWLRYLILMGIDTGIVLGAAGIIYLMGGSNQISNFYFLSSGVFFLIAVIPIFTEMGGNLRIAGKVLKGEDAEELAKTHSEKTQSGSRQTYLYGLAGITAFLLALILV